MVNVKPVQLGKTTRMSFGKISEALEMPNLIEVQKNSYKWFLEEGLKEVFRDVAAITDYNGNLVLNFVDYHLDETPKYSVAECKERDVTYAAPLRVKATLWNKETGDVKENEVFMGDFPLMTESGTFVINGAERVIVSQLVRSPGVYYSFEKDKTKAKHSPGNYYFRSGRCLKKYCQMLVDSGEELNGEYYASMPYNFMVRDGLKVWIPTNIEYFCQWGTPEDMRESIYWINMMKEIGR